jgi:hypothetical protein
MNKIDAEYRTGCGVFHHISVSRVDKEARRRIGWDRRSGPRGKLRWFVVSQ